MKIVICIISIFVIGCTGIRKDDKKATSNNVKSGVEWRKQGDSLFLKLDTLRALECWREAAALNDSVAKYYLGLCYLEGCGVVQDSSKAIDYCRQSAKQGYPVAQFTLGSYYFEGKMVKRDNNQAYFWINKSVLGGLQKGVFALGCLLYNGQGIIPDKKRGLNLIEKAALRGNRDAQVMVGDIYYAERNFEMAKKWYQRATSQGDKEAEKKLKERFVEKKKIEKVPAEIVKEVEEKKVIKSARVSLGKWKDTYMESVGGGVFWIEIYKEDKVYKMKKTDVYGDFIIQPLKYSVWRGMKKFIYNDEVGEYILLREDGSLTFCDELGSVYKITKDGRLLVF